MSHWDEDPILIATHAQWAFIAQNRGLPGLEILVSQSVEGSWAEPFAFSDWKTLPQIDLYSSVGDSFDLAHGAGTKGLYAVSPKNTPFPGPPTSQPAPQVPPDMLDFFTLPSNPGGVQFSPLPELGGSMSMLPGPIAPIAGGALKELLKKLFGGIAQAGGFRNVLRSALVALGGTQLYDIVDQWMPWADDAAKEKMAHVLEAFATLEELGLIYPWAPRARRDGGVTAGPFYMIFDLTNVQGHYTNFHMSRAGLRKHDDDQDTHRRPRRQRRTTK